MSPNMEPSRTSSSNKTALMEFGLGFRNFAAKLLSTRSSVYAGYVVVVDHTAPKSKTDFAARRSAAVSGNKACGSAESCG